MLIGKLRGNVARWPPIFSKLDGVLCSSLSSEVFPNMGLTSGETSHSLTLLEAARFRYPAVPSVNDSGRSRMSSEEYQDNEPETSKRPSQKPLRLEEVCRRIGAGGRQRHCRKFKEMKTKGGIKKEKGGKSVQFLKRRKRRLERVKMTYQTCFF